MNNGQREMGREARLTRSGKFGRREEGEQGHKGKEEGEGRAG